MEKEIECDNIFCFHYEPDKAKLADWNKTRCSFYEVDPYYKGNKNGFKIEDCEALKKYKKFGW